MSVPPSRNHRRAAGAVAAGALALTGLTACGSSHDGWVAVAMDGAGRLTAVVAVCDGQQLSALTLTDNVTGTSTTVRPKDAPAFGATMILTSPIVNPQPEGAMDLLNLAHGYTISGATRKTDSDKDSGSLASLTFRLDAIAKEPKLRQDSVLALGGDEEKSAVMTKADFVAQAKQDCS